MIIVCTAFWVNGWVSGMIQMVVSFVPFGLKSHGGGCQITGLSGDWIRNKHIPDLYISLSVVLIVCFSSWFLSTPFSCSLWWLYSPERQHSSLNASITQTSRYNPRLFPSLLGAKSLIAAISKAERAANLSAYLCYFSPPAGVVPEVDRLRYPFLYVWTTEGETSQL